MTSKIIHILSTISIILFCCTHFCAQSSFEKSNSFNRSVLKNSRTNRESAANDYIGIYQKYISGIRGHECPMYPSCSTFGLKTFSERNFCGGLVMTSDRVMRCGHDHKVYSLTLGEKGFKYLDFPAYETPSKDLIYSRNSYSYYYADTIPDNDSTELISNLMNHQYYHEALLEIIRSELLMENFSVELFINKVICLMSLGEHEKALFEYENRCPPEHKTNAELAYQIALVYYRTDNFSSALQFTSTAARNCRDPFCNGKISLLTGLLYAHQGDWGNSYNAFDSLKDSENFRDVAVMNARLSENAVSIKRKSPLLAGVMSVIPGLGYAYSGHFQTAISALLVNGLLAFATYSNFSKANYGMGALTAVFNVSFYLGNVYGSVNSAKRYNQMQKQSIINKLKFNSNL